MFPRLALPWFLLVAGPAVALSCRPVDRTLPAPEVPPDTLLLREWIPLTGPERSLGRRDRFDQRGCWTMAANTWLWVHDPVLARSGAPTLFWNGRFDDTPWFCLEPSDRWRLARAVRDLPPGHHVALRPGDRVAVRWTAVVDGSPRSVTHGLGRRLPATAGLEDLLGMLAAEGAWGASPEAAAPSVIGETAEPAPGSPAAAPGA